MKASIIITTYNRPLFLKRAVESCINQITDYTFEIIVVDDNGLGTDQQLETEKLIETYDNIIYIPLTKNAGACVARNMGVENARGEYIFFLDDDDAFLSNKVEVHLAYLKQRPYLSGCLAGMKRIDAATNQEIISATNYPVVGDFKNFVINGNFFTPMLCVKKRDLLKVDGFSEIARFQDRYLMLKALKNEQKFDCLQEQLHIMYEHQLERITDKSIDKSINALNTLSSFILKHKNDFSTSEWNLYLIKDYRMRGVIYYVSSHYFSRLKSIPYFFKSFLLSRSSSDLLRIMKTTIKI